MTEKYYIGIDTGTKHSALVMIRELKIVEKVFASNREIVGHIKTLTITDAVLAIEMFQGRGQKAGQESYDSIFIAGIFARTWQERNPNKPALIYRSEVKRHLCGTSATNDSNVRQAIIDMFPAIGGGACPQKGTKNQPGPLYGIAKHHWSALAVALTAQSGEYGKCRIEF